MEELLQINEKQFVTSNPVKPMWYQQRGGLLVFVLGMAFALTFLLLLVLNFLCTTSCCQKAKLRCTSSCRPRRRNGQGHRSENSRLVTEGSTGHVIQVETRSPDETTSEGNINENRNINRCPHHSSPQRNSQLDDLPPSYNEAIASGVPRPIPSAPRLPNCGVTFLKSVRQPNASPSEDNAPTAFQNNSGPSNWAIPCGVSAPSGGAYIMWSHPSFPTRGLILVTSDGLLTRSAEANN